MFSHLKSPHLSLSLGYLSEASMAARREREVPFPKPFPTTTCKVNFGNLKGSPYFVVLGGDSMDVQQPSAAVLHSEHQC